MLVTIGKTHHFIFDRRAITRSDPFNHPGIHWATIEVITDHVVGFLVGIRDIARYLLRMLRHVTHEREDRHGVITMLRRQDVKIDGTGVNTRRRTGFQAADA